MTFGTDVSPSQPIGGVTREAADQIIGKAIDAGINFMDTADVYGAGASETILGQVFGQRRKDLILATKLNGRMSAGVNDVGQSRVHVFRAVEDSLRRLKTDYIDLYQVHNFDPMTPLEETLRALDDLVRMGKVRYIGCSNYAGWQLAKALGSSLRYGWSRFETIQSYYSLAGRDIEREVLPAAISEGVGVLCWSPLAGGMLSGNMDRHTQAPIESRRSRVSFPPVDESVALNIIDVLKEISAMRQVAVPAVALAWLLTRPGVTSVICGISRLDQLSVNIKAVTIELSSDELAALDAVSRLPASYPGWIQTYRAESRVPMGFSSPRPSWKLGEAPI